MTDTKLTQLLEHLRRELSAAGTVDDRGRDLLRALTADIEALLERSETHEKDEPLLERLQESIDHFEDKYPSLTNAISSLLTFLNNAGI